jgi:hypothetical protein
MPDASKIGLLPTKLEFEKSLMFFHAYMYGPLQGKLRIYGARNISTGSIAMPKDWEVFASMLVDDLGQKLAAGIDLVNFEVKSAKRGGSYEYQYHKNTGLEKLIKDARVGHLFFDYTAYLEEINLRYVHGSDLAPEYFDKWLQKFPEKPEDYKGQRFRRSIAYGTVQEKGKLLMRLVDGEVVFPELASSEDESAAPAEESEEAETGEE